MLDTKTHHRTITEPIFLFSNGAGPLRMTTSPLRISGHSPQGNASGPRGRLPAHSLRLSPHIRQTQVHTAPCFSAVPLYMYPLCPSSSQSLSAGNKVKFKTFFKDIVKAIQPGKKVHFLPEDIFFYHLNLILTEVIHPLWGFLLTYELNDLYIGKKTVYLCSVTDICLVFKSPYIIT